MKTFNFIFFFFLGICFKSLFLCELYSQNLSQNDIVITGYDANKNSFKFTALANIPAGSKIFFTDDSKLAHSFNINNNIITDHNYSRLEGVVVFEPETEIPFGTEIEWRVESKNNRFSTYGSFYLSIIKDEIFVLQSNQNQKLISGLSFGKLDTLTKQMITQNEGVVVSLYNSLGRTELLTTNFNSKQEFLNNYFVEYNWGLRTNNNESINDRKLNKGQSVQDINDNVIEIMPLGDSVTRGKNKLNFPDFVGYRRPLYFLLNGAGYNVSTECFTGSIISDTVFTDFDTDHDGHGGYQAFTNFKSWTIWKDLYHNIDGSFSNDGGENWLGANLPDYILLHIGTNDIGLGESAESVVSQVSEVVDKIFNFNSDIELFLAQIINIDTTYEFAPAENFHETSLLNDLLLDSFVTHPNSSKIHFIDMESKLDYSIDLIDDVHPNDAGYSKMANVWFEAIQLFFRPNLISPSDQSIISSSNIVFNWSSNGPASKSYHLQIATDSLFDNIVIEETDLNTDSSETNSLLSGTNYFWRVRAKNYGGNSEWSSQFKFTTNPFQLSVRVFLHGAYLGDKVQSTLLAAGDLIPSQQPYNADPWNYTGIEEFDPEIVGIVDWILFSLSETPRYSQIFFQQALLVNSQGKIIDFDGDEVFDIKGVSSGEYYIFIEHHNHLSILSSNTILFE